MKIESRVLLVRGLCCGIALTAGFLLSGLTAPTARIIFAKPLPRTAHARVRPTKQIEQSRDQVRIPTVTPTVIKAAVKTRKEKKVLPAPEKQEIAQPVEIKPEEAKAPTPPLPDSVPLLDLQQQGISGAPPVPPDDLPPIAHFDDKPGGDILVLGVNLNSENRVIATDILIGSASPLNDLAFAMSSMGVVWKDVNPPIPSGQYRWVEVRVDFGAGKNKQSILP